MISILPLLQTPLVSYTIILTIIWIFVQIISRISSRNSVLNVDDRLTFAVLVFYVFLTVFSIYTDVNYFPYLHAVMLAFTLAIISCSPKMRLEHIFIVTLVVALMPVLVMTSTRHPLPLGDDARFIGFAKAIAEDGRWIPFKYAENSYYQFFHLIPFLEYALALILGFDLENVAAYYLALKFCLYFMYLLAIYLVMKRIIRDEFSSLVAILLLSITPPLALTQVVHQVYAIVLYLVTVLLLLRGFESKGLATNILAILPLLIAGVVAHATYTIMVTAFIIPFIIAPRERWIKNALNYVVRFIVLLLLTSLTYWIYTYVLDLIVRPTVNAIERLVDLLVGHTSYSLLQETTKQGITKQHSLFQGVAKPWYTSESSIFLISWALVPSMVASYIPLYLIPKVRRNIRFWNGVEALGLVGIMGTVLNYILRTLPTFGGRYFYWLYTLMIPLSTLVAKKTCRKLLSLIPSLIIISLVSFYGVQDPTLSANTYGNYIGWADRTSWEIAKGLIPYISSEARMWLDPRIGAPVSALTPPPPLGGDFSTGQVVAIISEDSVGFHAMSRDQRNVYFFKRYFNNDPSLIFNNLDNLNIIYRCRSYYGVTKP